MAKILFVDNDDSLIKKTSQALLHNSRVPGAFGRNMVESVVAQTLGSIIPSEPKNALKHISESLELEGVVLGSTVSQTDGLYLLKMLREKHCKSEVFAIVVVEQNEPQASLEYVEAGANDFVRMPFSPEELCFRIVQNKALQQTYNGSSAVNSDYLTHLTNRRYFYQTAEKLYASCQRGHIHLTCAMIDIDHFGFLNDTYGEKTGDVIIQQVGNMLGQRFRKSDLLTRYGGKKFCILNINLERGFAFSVFDQLRKKIEETEFECKEEKLKVTISTGVYTLVTDSLEELIRRAAVLLQTAKKNGGNRVLVE